MSPLTHLLYLHGFRSSPQSTKARQLGGWMQRHRPDVQWWCPQLPIAPRQAIDELIEGTAQWPRDRMAIVGSSLGGFYATVLAERLGCRAVVLNPVVDAARDLASYIGENIAWHDGTRFVFTTGHVDELRALRPAAISRPERYFAVIAKGDELLDWREMTSRYAGCHVKLIDGGDHALSDFETRHLDDVLQFLALTASR